MGWFFSSPAHLHMGTLIMKKLRKNHHNILLIKLKSVNRLIGGPIIAEFVILALILAQDQ
jgi:hypothetical protein